MIEQCRKLQNCSGEGFFLSAFILKGDATMRSIIDRLPENWEAELEYQLLLDQRDRYSKRAYICSPCSDSSKKEVWRNIRAARFYMFYAKKELCFIARAPHAFLPALLSDMIPSERALALRIGLDILESGDIVFVCGNKLTSGMRGEIEHAAKLGIPIQVFHPELYLAVRKIVTRMGADKHLVSHTSGHPALAMCTEDLFSLEVAKSHV